jgi:hypothetical protein
MFARTEDSTGVIDRIVRGMSISSNEELNRMKLLESFPSMPQAAIV